MSGVVAACVCVSTPGEGLSEGVGWTAEASVASLGALACPCRLICVAAVTSPHVRWAGLLLMFAHPYTCVFCCCCPPATIVARRWGDDLAITTPEVLLRKHTLGRPPSTTELYARLYSSPPLMLTRTCSLAGHLNCAICIKPCL